MGDLWFRGRQERADRSDGRCLHSGGRVLQAGAGRRQRARIRRRFEGPQHAGADAAGCGRKFLEEVFDRARSDDREPRDGGLDGHVIRRTERVNQLPDFGVR